MILLAILGAALGTIGDALCVLAVRRRSFGWMFPGALVWAACAPVFYAMSRRAGGSFVVPAAAWSTAAAICTALLALASGDRQTRGEWVGLALILLGAAVRGACAS